MRVATLPRKIAVLVTAAAIALTGCQQTANKTSNAPLPNTDWVRADYDMVKNGGTLTLSVSQIPDNWNSSQADGALNDLTKIRQPMGYEAEIRAAADGTLSFNKDYIESATVKSQNPTVISVKYNPKAVWEDGTPITINDLKAQIAAQSGTNPAYQVASTKGSEDVKEVRQTTDQFTGEVEFKGQYADWQSLVFPSLPASISNSPEAFNKGYTTKSTPSYGPYRVKSIDTNGQVITLERNPKWWGRQGKLDTIIFKVVTQAQAPQAFANGELDARELENGNEYATAKKRADGSIQKTNGLSWSHITINTTRGALGDIKVRQAMGLAINRTLIGQAVVGPFEVPVSLVNNPVYVPGQKGYQDVYHGALDKQDPAKAEQMLKDAGYTKGSDGVYAKDGKSLSFSITVPAGTKSNIDRATQIQKDLNAIGFKIDLQTVPGDQYFKSYINVKNFDLATFTWKGTLYPLQSAANILSPIDSKQNHTGYANPKIAELNQKANSEFDPEKRIELGNQMAEAMLSDYTLIPFYATPVVFSVKKELVNYGASQFENYDWTMVGWSAA